MTAIILTTDEVKAKLIAMLANQCTPKFISVRNYTNQEGEVSNYVVNIGADFATAKESDGLFLLDGDNLKTIDFGNVASYSEEARIALLEANMKLTRESVVRSEAQTNAYTTICENIRMHNETGRLYIYGFRVSKTVLVPGNYGPDTRRALTIAKDRIREKLKASKFRQFCLDKIVEVRMNGETLEFDLA
jgi:hypothetical protein